MALRGRTGAASAAVRSRARRPGARLTRGARALLSRRDFFQGFTEQLRLGEPFQRAASEMFRKFRDVLNISFRDVQIAGSRVFRARTLANIANEFGLGQRFRVRDFALIPAFGDVVGARTRFIVGVLLDAQAVGLQGGMLRFLLEFDRPPSLRDIIRRLEDARRAPRGRIPERYRRLDELLARGDVSLETIDLEWMIRLF